MGRPVKIDLATGAGSSTEFLMGTVTVESTTIHYVGNTLVLPDPVDLPLFNGAVTHPDMAPSPEGPEPVWAYKFTFTSGITGRSWSQLRGVPDGTTEINYKDLPLFQNGPNAEELAPSVDYLVKESLANDSTVMAAVSDAIDTEITGRSIAEIPPIAESDLLFAVVDEDGRRTWIEADLDGHPTAYSAGLVAEAVTTPVANAVGVKDQDTDITGIAFAVVDEDGLRTELEVGEDGKFTQRVIDSIASRMEVTSTPTMYRDTYTSTLRKIASGPDITLFGDSMTAADWATELASLTGRTVHKNGVGGETSAGIAARANAMPYMMLPTGGSIPASGSVDVTFTSAGGGTSWPLLQGSGTPNGKMEGTLAGVAGEVTVVRDPAATPYVHHSGDRYVFTRTTAGTAVPLTRPAPFFYTYGESLRGDITVIWAGRNNWQDGGDRAYGDIKAMTEYLSTLDKRFLVLSVHTGTNEGTGTDAHTKITGLNTRLMREYGRRFVDHRRYLIDYGLADLGLTPTAQDLADVAADTVPQSLRSDSIHQTPEARSITAKQVNDRLKEMGWV